MQTKINTIKSIKDKTKTHDVFRYFEVFTVRKW